jgi:hypothetical protein
LSNRANLKFLDVLHRRIHGVGAGDVHQLKRRGRDGSPTVIRRCQTA